MLIEWKDNLISSPKDGAIYLLQKLNDDAGFFTVDGKLLYVVKNSAHEPPRSVKTEYLEFRTSISIQALEILPQFESGTYNLIQYSGDITDTNFESFVRLCTLHSKHIESIGFYKFFNSLIDIFQLPKEQRNKNLIGLYGELKFIKETYQQYGVDLSQFWHGKSMDRYDFSCPHVNFEVKTTMSNPPVIHLKHDQIFNDANNYLIVISLVDDNSGETLGELIQYFKEEKPFTENYNFQMSIEHEHHRVSKEFETRKFTVRFLRSFNVSKLETLQGIPDRISDITYHYDISGLKGEDYSSVLP